MFVFFNLSFNKINLYLIVSRCRVSVRPSVIFLKRSSGGLRASTKVGTQARRYMLEGIHFEEVELKPRTVWAYSNHNRGSELHNRSN